MTWVGTGPLAIAQPRGARYDEIAHEALAQREPLFDEWNSDAAYDQHRKRGATAGVTKAAYQRRRSAVLQFLDERGSLTREQIWSHMSDTFPLSAQVGRLLTAMQAEGAVVQVEAGGPCKQARWARKVQS